jgi:hypothetical protein
VYRLAQLFLAFNKDSSVRHEEELRIEAGFVERGMHGSIRKIL